MRKCYEPGTGEVVIHSPYTYGGRGKVFCNMCQAELSPDDLALIRATFRSSCCESGECRPEWEPNT